MIPFIAGLLIGICGTIFSIAGFCALHVAKQADEQMENLDRERLLAGNWTIK